MQISTWFIRPVIMSSKFSPADSSQSSLDEPVLTTTFLNAAINIYCIATRSGANLPGEFGDIAIERRSHLRMRSDTSRTQNSIPKSTHRKIGL